MAELVEVILKDNQTLMVETDAPEDQSRRNTSVDARPPQVRFAEALEAIKQAANDLVETLQTIDARPNSCELTFGVKVSGSLGAVLAKASSEANFTVKMTWTGLKDAKPGDGSGKS